MLDEQRTYSISTTADLLGVSCSWLRLAERVQAIPPARRTKGGHRIYSPEDVEQLRELGVGSRPRKLRRVDEVLEAAR